MMNVKVLIDWYETNKRPLPWRETQNPYYIWLSEIILQQTQVVQGLPYYEKFVKHYPSINDLAKADEQEVLNLWQGLGYYSRARNLHFTAKYIVDHLDGVFPDNYKDLLKLKGVGPYTAAAIASFSYKEPVAVLDGNVFRVLSRLFGIDTPINSTEGQKIFKKLSQDLIDKNQPAVYNQAIMEFGALHCTPALPKCDSCPLVQNCVAYQTGQVSNLPVKLKKVKVKNRYLNYFVVRHNDAIILQKREGKGIWQNLYQLPLIETKSKSDISHEQLQELYQAFNIQTDQMPKFITETTHKLTHQHLNIKFWQVDSLIKPANLIDKSQIKDYPMPIVIAKFLDNYIL
jgi:A/G-specific adenine glycosylase